MSTPQFTNLPRYFWPLFIVSFLVANALVFLNLPLENEISPNRISSYAEAGDAVKAHAIKTKWLNSEPIYLFGPKVCPSESIYCFQFFEFKNARQIAKWQLLIDFPFIILYVWIIFLLLRRMRQAFLIGKENQKSRMYTMGSCFAWGIIIAGIFDLIENIGLYRHLMYDQTSMLGLVKWMSKGKRLLIQLSIIYLAISLIRIKIDEHSDIRTKDEVKFWDYIQYLYRLLFERIIKTLWYSRLSVICVFLLWFVLNNVDQGQDLLLGISDNPEHVFLFYSFIFSLAVFNWYIPGYFLPEYESKKIDAPKRSFLRKMFIPVRKLGFQYGGNMPATEDWFHINIPRLLGIMTILVVYGAIVDILVINGVFSPYRNGTLQVLVFISLFTITLIPSVKKHIDKVFFKVYHFGASDEQGKKAFSISSIILPFIILLIWIAFMGYMNYRLYFHQPFAAGGMMLLASGFLCFACLFYLLIVYKSNIYLWKKIPENWPISVVYIGIISSAILLYTANLWPKFAGMIGALSVIAIGLNFYMGVVAYLSIRPGKNSYLLSFVLLILSGVFLINFKTDNDFHNVRLVDNRWSNDQRQELSTYIDTWVQDRLSNWDTTVQMPIVLVTAEGGGSRAAYWTALVNARLDRRSEGLYRRQLFSLSGASGGTFGASVFTSFCAANSQPDATETQITNIFKKDFLSSSVANLFGADLIQGFLPLSLFKTDRAVTLEEDWEKAINQYTQSSLFDNNYLNLWYPLDSAAMRTDVPLLFCNTAQMDRGEWWINSPVKLEMPTVGNIKDLVQQIYDSNLEQKGMRLSTATLLSARFPYLNPTGRIPELGHFADAGYYDNYGVTTTNLIFEQLEKYIAEKALEEKVKIVLVEIHNGEGLPPGIEPTESDSDGLEEQFELTAPISGLYNVRSGHNNYLLHQLRSKIPVANRIRFQLEHRQRIIPLGRFLSRSAQLSIRQSLDSIPFERSVDKLRMAGIPLNKE